MSINIKTRWDKDLIPEFDLHVQRLRDEMVRSIQQRFEHTTGRLENSMRYRASSRMLAVEVSSDVPYAMIQDQGGVIPERHGLMQFMVGSIEVFTRHAKAFVLPAKAYIEAAVDEWFETIDIKWKG